METKGTKKQPDATKAELRRMLTLCGIKVVTFAGLKDKLKERKDPEEIYNPEAVPKLIDDALAVTYQNFVKLSASHQRLREALCLARSMILGGEQMSDVAHNMINGALQLRFESKPKVEEQEAPTDVGEQEVEPASTLLSVVPDEDKQYDKPLGSVPQTEKELAMIERGKEMGAAAAKHCEEKIAAAFEDNETDEQGQEL